MHHSKGEASLWTHPGKVEAPYTVCIASASNLTGLVRVQRRVPTDWIIEPIDVSGYLLRRLPCTAISRRCP